MRLPLDNMITIISGTNRKDSMTIRVASLYYRLFSEKTGEVRLLRLDEENIWEEGPALNTAERDYLIPSEKFVFIMPEYNGSFPGVLKMMMDNTDIKKCWWYKKAMLAGVADGRGGNLRGMDHMTGILHYLRVSVLYNKIAISRVKEEIDEEGNLLKPATENAIRNQVEEFLKF